MAQSLDPDPDPLAFVERFQPHQYEKMAEHPDMGVLARILESENCPAAAMYKIATRGGRSMTASYAARAAASLACDVAYAVDAIAARTATAAADADGSVQDWRVTAMAVGHDLFKRSGGNVS
ncbi:MAG: hypothetical protein ACYDGY_01255 [Acidimicrobiales bacterium]